MLREILEHWQRPVVTSSWMISSIIHYPDRKTKKNAAAIEFHGLGDGLSAMSID